MVPLPKIYKGESQYQPQSHLYRYHFSHPPQKTGRYRKAIHRVDLKTKLIGRGIGVFISRGYLLCVLE